MVAKAFCCCCFAQQALSLTITLFWNRSASRVKRIWFDEDVRHFCVTEKCFYWSTETELSASEIFILAITPPNLPGAFVCLQFPNSHHASKRCGSLGDMQWEIIWQRLWKYFIHKSVYILNSCIVSLKQCKIPKSRGQHLDVMRSSTRPRPPLPPPFTIKDFSRTVPRSASPPDDVFSHAPVLTDMQCLCGSNNTYFQTWREHIQILIWGFPSAFSALSLTKTLLRLRGLLLFEVRFQVKMILLCIQILPNAFKRENHTKKKDLDAYRRRVDLL